MAKAKKGSAGSGTKGVADVTPSRAIKDVTKQRLIAAAGGRCEFAGCNALLFEHHVTKRGGYFGNYAHIRAFSGGGPRARTTGSRTWINEIDNLMLLCPTCHKHVDTEPGEFTVAKLQAWKREHEERVHYLLGLPPKNEAAMLEVWTDVSRPPVVRSHGKLVAALLPLYPSRRHTYLVDFAGRTLEDATLVGAATQSIDREVDRLFANGAERPPHLAVFGIANIPLLVHLGSKLGDRVQVHLFQHHRDTSDWRWKDEAPTAAFERRQIQAGTARGRVALVLSLSGAIARSTLPDSIDSTHAIWELRLTSATPSTAFLRTREDLARFREAYRALLAEIRSTHPGLRELALFPAVPIPVAVAIGLDRLPKVDAALVVHDFDKNSPTPGWRSVLTVN